MKRLWIWFMDSRRQVLQIVLIVLVTLIPRQAWVGELIDSAIMNDPATFANLQYHFVIHFGITAGGCFLFFLMAFYFVRKSNGDYVLNQLNYYHDEPYIFHLINAKLLGYKKCSLIRVPIYSQFRLILHQVYIEFITGDDSTYTVETKDTAPVSVQCGNRNMKEICILLIDTYPISEDQLPESLRSQYRVVVDRNPERNPKDANRYYNGSFVHASVNAIRDVPDATQRINVFATTNVKHTWSIVNDASDRRQRACFRKKTCPLHTNETR